MATALVSSLIFTDVHQKATLPLGFGDTGLCTWAKPAATSIRRSQTLSKLHFSFTESRGNVSPCNSAQKISCSGTEESILKELRPLTSQAGNKAGFILGTERGKMYPCEGRWGWPEALVIEQPLGCHFWPYPWLMAKLICLVVYALNAPRPLFKGTIAYLKLLYHTDQNDQHTHYDGFSVGY